MFPDESSFRVWVDQTPKSQIPDTNDFDQILKHFDLSNRDFVSLANVRDALKYREKISALLIGSDFPNIGDVRRLRDHLILRYFLDGENIDPYLTVIE
ncbi:MAG: hypothetical protein ACYDHG_14545, partial [Desulfomonilaceae bacterium]